MYSAIDGKEETLSLVTTDDLKYKTNERVLTPSNFIFRRFEIEPFSFLNSQYFQLNEENYVALNTAKLLKPVEEYATNIQIELLRQGSLKSKDSTQFLIKIINRNKEPIPSHIDAQVFISYHWFDEGGGQKVWDGKRTKIEVDVHDSYLQEMIVLLPEHKGNFIFLPDLVIEGKEWFNLQDKYNLRVD